MTVTSRTRPESTSRINWEYGISREPVCVGDVWNMLNSAISKRAITAHKAKFLKFGFIELPELTRACLLPALTCP
ncbi:conserved hypothetical protein [Agrobacterium genomosp. 13 str. CFBP 6927]|uniref:Uncharacterized protein n=1 Tax=Agrobacterium genomosp. 13 str. CFBP 6927 TaxID=1183428 RepID=A0ABP2BTJ3_9HYPH|nr:conserved hypothetical protein [Agrobacterium genomosp. 13 str. CFBP 6927]